jgi:hypothetical protein
MAKGSDEIEKGSDRARAPYLYGKSDLAVSFIAIPQRKRLTLSDEDGDSWLSMPIAVLDSRVRERRHPVSIHGLAGKRLAYRAIADLQIESLLVLVN